MANSSDWYTPRGSVRSSASAASMGVLRVVLLFGSAAAALAVILTPIADRQSRNYAQNVIHPGIDRISTGSVQRYSGKYTVRRSVLQNRPDSVCIIRDNGVRNGDC